MGSDTNDSTDLQSIQTEIRYDNYLFQIAEQPEGKISFDVIDIKTLQVFRVQQYVFKGQANIRTLIAALQKKQEKNFHIEILKGKTTDNNQNDKDDDIPSLTVILRVTYQFIPHFQENILLSLREGVSESELIQTQLRLIEEDIQVMQTELSTQILPALKKHVFVVKDGYYDQYAHTILQFQLPKGKYRFELTMHAQSSEKWIFLKLTQNSNEILNLEENGFQLPQNEMSVYDPIYIQGLIEVYNDFDQFNLSTSECDSYCWSLKNLILSANHYL